MNTLKRFAGTAGLLAAFASFMLISAGPVFAGSPNSTSGTTSSWSSIPGLLQKPAATTTPAPVIQPGASVNIRDHRTPGGSRNSSGGPPPAAPPGTVPTTPPSKVVGPIERDHRPGGNADPCLKKNNTCSARDREISIDEFRKQNPNTIGLGNDPCFQTNSCNERQMIESLIAQHEKKQFTGFCDSGIKGQGCAQQFDLPDGKGGHMSLILHFEHNKGPLLEKDRQYLLQALQKAHDRSLSVAEAASTRVTDKRNGALKDHRK